MVAGQLEADVVVLGAGPAGLVAAAALAQLGFRVAAVGPRAATAAEDEGRTAALFPEARDVLDRIGVWPKLATVSEPIRAIRIVDAMGRLLRAPEVLFEAREAGVDVLAHNVPNGPLVAALEDLVGNCAGLERVTDLAGEVVLSDDRAIVRVAGGREISGRLLVAADGRKSFARTAAGIAVKAWRYEQTAIATSFTHSRPHAGVSTEFHRAPGPFTVVPMPGLTSSLVWLERPEEAERLLGLDDTAFAAAMARPLAGLLGAIRSVRPRLAHAMGGLIAERRAARRVALIGETAHAFPPIGAQGLNLTLRDVAELVDRVQSARAAGGDIGGPDVLDAYDQARAPDIASRVYGVDLLNRSLIAGPLPGLARGIGLHALHAVPALKRFAMRQGFGAVQPTGHEPHAGHFER